MFKIRPRLDALSHRLLAVLLRGLEALEYAFHSLLSARLRRKNRRLLTDLEASDAVPSASTNWIDSFEWLFQRLLVSLPRILVPWKWKRQPEPTAVEPESYARSNIDHFESNFDQLLSIFAAFLPWRWLRRRSVVADAGNEDRVVGADTLETGFDRLFAHVASSLGKEQEEDPDQPQGLLARGMAAMRRSEFFLTRAVVDGVDFSSEWWYSRDLFKLAWATPAVVLSIPLLALVVLIPHYSRDAKIKHYQAALLNASQASDVAAEQLFQRKLVKLGYQGQDRAEFRRAIAVANEGKFEHAYEIMKAIAPLDEPRFLYGHLWIAGALLEGHIEEENRWQVLILHARHAENLNAYDPVVQRLMVEVHLHEGKIREANRLMEANVASYPSYHATLMHNYHEAGESIEAKKHAKRAIEFFESHESELEISALGCLRWAEAYEILGDFDNQQKQLVKATQRFPDDESLRLALSLLTNRQLDGITLESENVVTILAEVFQADPSHSASWKMILTGFQNDPPRVEAVLEQLQERGTLPASFHKLLGDVYFQQNHYPKATVAYETACRLDSHSSVAWNNLAWIRGNIDPVDIQAALDAANRAISQNPDPRFYETRGQLWIKLEDWDAAISDLGRAVNGRIPDQAAVHLSLAEAYRRTGRVELAAAHRSLANRPRP